MAKKASLTTTESQAFKQEVKAVVTKLINQYFMGSLGKERDIINIVMAVIQHESSFRPNKPGPEISHIPTPTQEKGSRRARQYMESDPVKAIMASGSETQRRNVSQGRHAQGLMQVMGWNIVKGGSNATHKCEIEESGRGDIIDIVCVNAGDSIEAKLLGKANIETNILAGLTLLEMKYKAVKPKAGVWAVGGFSFSSRVAGMLASYRGLGPKDLANGQTMETYVSRIMYGESYKLANGSSGGSGPGTVVVAANDKTTAPQTPPTNGSSSGTKDVGTTPDCA